MSQIIHTRVPIIAVLSVIALILLLPGPTPAAAQDVAIVANQALGSDSVSQEDLADIFLGKKSTWASGEEAVFVIFDDADSQDKFMLQYIKKNPSQFKNYWKKRVFTGKGRMPKYLKSKAEVVDFVKAYPGAVSFLPAPAEGDVKTLNVK